MPYILKTAGKSMTWLAIWSKTEWTKSQYLYVWCENIKQTVFCVSTDTWDSVGKYLKRAHNWQFTPNNSYPSLKLPTWPLPEMLPRSLYKLNNGFSNQGQGYDRNITVASTVKSSLLTSDFLPHTLLHIFICWSVTNHFRLQTQLRWWANLNYAGFISLWQYFLRMLEYIY